MALIKCVECNKEISTEADFCPNCGYKKKTATPPPLPVSPVLQPSKVVQPKKSNI